MCKVLYNLYKIWYVKYTIWYLLTLVLPQVGVHNHCPSAPMKGHAALCSTPWPQLCSTGAARAAGFGASWYSQGSASPFLSVLHFRWTSVNSLWVIVKCKLPVSWKTLFPFCGLGCCMTSLPGSSSTPLTSLVVLPQTCWWCSSSCACFQILQELAAFMLFHLHL